MKTSPYTRFRQLIDSKAHESSYDGRIFSALKCLNAHTGSAAKLIHNISRYDTFAEISVALKFYIIAWATLADVIALLINNVLDLGLPKKSIDLPFVLSNEHAKRTKLPSILKKHEKKIKAHSYLAKRNDIVHRSLLNEPAIEKLGRRIDGLYAQRMMGERSSKQEEERALKKLKALARERQAQYQRHWQDTQPLVEEVIEELIRILHKRRTS